jgi:hypothetical protein
MLRVEEFIQAIGQADAEMPEGVQKEDEQKDEETLGCDPSRRSVRFEKAEVKSL